MSLVNRFQIAHRPASRAGQYGGMHQATKHAKAVGVSERFVAQWIVVRSQQQGGRQIAQTQRSSWSGIRMGSIGDSREVLVPAISPGAADRTGIGAAQGFSRHTRVQHGGQQNLPCQFGRMSVARHQCHGGSKIATGPLSGNITGASG